MQMLDEKKIHIDKCPDHETSKVVEGKRVVYFCFH